MKAVFLLVLGGAIAAALAIPIDDGRQSGEGGWYVPQLDGSFKWVTEDEAEQLRQTTSGRSVTSVNFYLYTAENPTTADTLAVDDVASLESSHFNKANPTRIIIHGWQSAGDSDINTTIRDAYLSVGNFNIIVVDWSDKSQSINYVACTMRVSGVGKQVANLIDFLYKDAGLSFDTLHVIGHSLGAHIAGHAGKNVKYGSISQITGLDPALPLYSFDKPSERLNQNDATYVETIQTCGGLLGFLDPIGKAAFYPNGGKSQPGCGLDLVGSCAHGRSWLYFAESVSKNNYAAMKCENLTTAVGKSCGKTYSAIRMNAISNYVNANGHYYVPVNKKEPYGMGD